MITDWGTAIFNALSNAVNLILTFIPRLIGFLVILVVGLIIATVVSKAVTFLLRKIGFDRLAERIGLTRFEQRMGVRMDAAGILGKIVYWFILLIFLVPAADALGLPAVSNILNTLVAYIPNVFVAILYCSWGAWQLLSWLTWYVERWPLPTLAILTSWRGLRAGLSIGFAALIALEQLKIAPDLINELFGAMVAAVAIAFGLAFGLGGQDAARRWLARGESTVSNAADQIDPQQVKEQARAATQMQEDRMRPRSQTR